MVLMQLEPGSKGLQGTGDQAKEGSGSCLWVPGPLLLARLRASSPNLARSDPTLAALSSYNAPAPELRPSLHDLIVFVPGLAHVPSHPVYLVSNPKQVPLLLTNIHPTFLGL